MPNTLTPLQVLQAEIASGSITGPTEAALRCANSNASRNVYLEIDPARVRTEAAALAMQDWRGIAGAPLLGVPVSVKDCFDVAGYVTTCGSKFYGAGAAAVEDAWITKQIRMAGGVVTGKTHMQQLAYGITGENADYGACVQPWDAGLLTGGSSSGAVASVQEGSAVVAIGTDTGGSVRVPAALGGLAGFRASIGVGSFRGGVHLAQSFDTLGFLWRDMRDGPVIGEALLGIKATKAARPRRMAVVADSFLSDCNDVVLAAYALQKEQMRALGVELVEVATEYWSESMSIFAPIQAHEAAALQRRLLAGRAGFEVFEPGIAERLAWGETITAEELAALRKRHEGFRAAMDATLAEYEYLLLPCAPTHEFRAGADHSKTRQQVLRYTTPISLAGMPTVTLSHTGGAGMQLVAARGRDAELLGFAASLQVNVAG